MNGDETMFGVNFADGRIKGYGTSDPRTGSPKKFFLMYVVDFQVPHVMYINIILIQMKLLNLHI